MCFIVHSSFFCVSQNLCFSSSGYMYVWWWFHIIGSYNPHDTETWFNSCGCDSGWNPLTLQIVYFLHSVNPVCCLCVTFSRGKTNYINLGSFLIKPVQRVMRYPLLLVELLGATPEGHHDRPQLTQALKAVKEINVNINEYKRRKDLGKNHSKPDWFVVIFCRFYPDHTIWFVLPLLSTVVKYRKGDEDTFIDKISKLSMHSIIKKSNRVSSHLKHLTGISPQVHHLVHPSWVLSLSGRKTAWELWMKVYLVWFLFVFVVFFFPRLKTKRLMRLRRSSGCRRDSSSLLSGTFPCICSI